MDGYGAREERDAMTMDAMDRTPPITAGVTSLLRAPAATGTVLYTTTLTERRQVTVIVEGNPSATASIASLSSALVAAQASASLLAQQNQQLQIASASAVASAQAAAQLSASSLAASISSSAAVALASAAGAVANANNAASAAMQSANAALASASVIQVSRPAREIIPRATGIKSTSSRRRPECGVSRTACSFRRPSSPSPSSSLSSARPSSPWLGSCASCDTEIDGRRDGCGSSKPRSSGPTRQAAMAAGTWYGRRRSSRGQGGGGRPGSRFGSTRRGEGRPGFLRRCCPRRSRRRGRRTGRGARSLRCSGTRGAGRRVRGRPVVAARCCLSSPKSRSQTRGA